jgi:hypothetical protein
MEEGGEGNRGRKKCHFLLQTREEKNERERETVC